MRRAFLGLVYPAGSDAGGHRVAALERLLATDAAWQPAHRDCGLSVWTGTDAPFPVRVCGDVTIIGDYFPGSTSGPTRLAAANGEPASLARRVAAEGWGQYAAIIRTAQGAGVLRDPSGMVDVHHWSLGDEVSVIASDPWRAPAGLRPRWPGLNWDRIARFVTVPTAMTTASLLDGLVAVGPGDFGFLTDAARPQAIWSPLTYAQAPLPTGDRREAQQDLAQAIVGTTARLMSGHRGTLVELSGGLDSSSLAGVIGYAGLTDLVRTWLNLVDRRPEGDEAAFADAVAQRLGVPLTRVDRAPGRICVSDLAELAAEPWPAIAGVDASRDRDAAARIIATDATAIVSGQGGDAVFFQMGAPVVAADVLDAKGWRGLFGPILPDLARRTRTNVWDILHAVAAARRGRLPERKIVNRLVTPEVEAFAAGSEHAWTASALSSDLPLGKRLHIRAIASAHINHQYSRRRRVADILFPLLAQPVLERALRIPSYVLAGGAYDRPFQRETFAELLPPAVLQRRAKGNASVYFARLMANSLAELRPYLLDGVLCDAGVLDRRTLETVLTPEHLIWRDAANDLVTALATEAWVRHWQTRLPDSAAAGR